MREDPGPEREQKTKQYAARGIVAAVVVLFLFGAAGLILLLLGAAVFTVMAAVKKKGTSGPEAGGGWAGQIRAAFGGRDQARQSVQDACAVMRQRIGQLRGEEPMGPVRRQGSVETHDHIPSTALDTKRRLEQLKTLKGAGLYTPQEYEAKRREILAGK